MQIINQSNGKVIATKFFLAKSFWHRLRGLLGRKLLPSGEALVLEPCSSVHSCFMRFSIDIVFIDKQKKIIYLQENLTPWHFSPVVRKAKAVIELPAGSIKAQSISLGDTLLFCNKEAN